MKYWGSNFGFFPCSLWTWNRFEWYDLTYIWHERFFVFLFIGLNIDGWIQFYYRRYLGCLLAFFSAFVVKTQHLVVNLEHFFEKSCIIICFQSLGISHLRSVSVLPVPGEETWCREQETSLKKYAGSLTKVHLSEDPERMQKSLGWTKVDFDLRIKKIGSLRISLARGNLLFVKYN